MDKSSWILRAIRENLQKRENGFSVPCFLPMPICYGSALLPGESLATTHGRHARAKYPFCCWGHLACADVRSAGSPTCLGQEYLPWRVGWHVDLGSWFWRGTLWIILPLDYSNCGAPGLGLSPQGAWAFASPNPAHFRWHYRVYMREHRAPQQSLSQGNRKLTSGNLGCLCSEAADKAETAGRGKLLDT